MNLTQQQRQVLDSIKEFMESDASVFILRGYAGTGKTTMVNHIADYIAQSRNVKLMAPTGRAARVLCGNEPFRTMDIDEKNDSEPEDYPAAMTAEEVFGCCRGN